MTKTNSFGGGLTSTPQNSQKQPSQKYPPSQEVVINVNPKAVDRIISNYSSILCCLITTSLVGLGVGISIWYSVTEIV
jgi:hypothetical protein